MANGEAYRQEVGVISSGSYQNHFLLDLSDEERERDRMRQRGKKTDRARKVDVIQFLSVRCRAKQASNKSYM